MRRRSVPPGIAAALPDIVRAAQQTYDEWHQDKDMAPSDKRIEWLQGITRHFNSLGPRATP